MQRGLDRVDHLHPAGVAAEAVDFLLADAQLGAHTLHRAGEFGLDERRDGAVEDDRQAGVVDIPAHDPQRIRPQLLGRTDDPRQAVKAAGHDRGSGAVAEQSGGDDGCRVVAVEADRD